nr:rod shape-determining protein [uncultured Shuttleworthia sp.]
MSNAYGIDFGTGNLKIFSKASNDITNIKDTIALVNRNQMYSYGDAAYAMYEKAPANIEVSFPIINGVIADFDNMQTMIYEVLESDLKANIKRSDIVVAVPNDITEVEKKAFFDIFAKAKVRPHSIRICEKPLADAIGMGVDVNEPKGVMVVDMGADTTEISVVSLGGIVISELLPMGGNQLDDSIVTYIRRQFNLVIGRKTAKMLKEEIGSAIEDAQGALMIVGRDVVSGLPMEFEVDAKMVYEGMRDDLQNLATAIKLLLEKVPPELAKDIVHSGIYLTGGGSNIRSLDAFIKSITNIQMNVAERGEETVVMGLSSVVTDAHYSRFGYEMKSRNIN